MKENSFAVPKPNTFCIKTDMIRILGINYLAVFQFCFVAAYY